SVRHFFVHLFARMCRYLDAPSFPTRRSADLWRLGSPSATSGGGSTDYDDLVIRGSFAYVYSHVNGTIDEYDLLSNEHSVYDGAQIGKHTSELQSRENLVCRLLLEK